MGQKVNPIGFRVGIHRVWESNWYADNNVYADYLVEDLGIRKYVQKNLTYAGISRVEISRASNAMIITIYTARPGIVIGRGGKEIEKLEHEISKIVSGEIEVKLDIKEIKTPELEAALVAENVAQQLVKRIAFRRAMKRAVMSTMSAGGKGIKIQCSGRLGGAEIARTEGYKEGKIPLQTLRADIDYALAEAVTTYGTIGVKVWIYRGDFVE